MRNQSQEDRFESVLLEYDGAIRRLACAYERQIDSQSDLVQEIWLAIWKALPSFRGDSSERTFIYRIAHNRALTHIARRSPNQLELNMALEVPDSSPDPEQAFTLGCRQAELRARIAALPLILRQVVMLAMEDMSTREIGQVLGISDGNVNVRLTRAKKQLKLGGIRQ